MKKTNLPAFMAGIMSGLALITTGAIVGIISTSMYTAMVAGGLA